MGMADTLVLIGLHKRFGALQATDNVSLNLKQGEVHALIGPNGAGESTLIQLISGGLQLDSGDIFLQGKNITRLNMNQRVHQGLARSFQITTIFGRLTVRQNLLLAVQGAEANYFSFF